MKNLPEKVHRSFGPIEKYRTDVLDPNLNPEALKPMAVDERFSPKIRFFLENSPGCNYQAMNINTLRMFKQPAAPDAARDI